MKSSNDKQVKGGQHIKAAQVNASAKRIRNVFPAAMKCSTNNSQTLGVLDTDMLSQAKKDVSAMSFDQKLAAAKHENTSAATLTVLAEDNNWVVRANVARNKNTPSEVLAVLAKDDERCVQVYVASNHSTDPGVLVELSHDRNENVAHNAQRNPSLPLSRILELVHHRHYHQRIQVVNNPSLTYENLSLMLSDRSVKVRKLAEEALYERNDSAIIG